MDGFNSQNPNGLDPFSGEVDTQPIQATQSTQEASQKPASEDHLWGCLQPCSSGLVRIDFWKKQLQYRLGRNGEANDLWLPGLKVSNKHCTITWDGIEDRSSVITIVDLSSNGTFINGEKIGKNKTSILREGNEIAFGTCQPQPEHPKEDFRYIYRHLAAGPAREGLYAHYDLGTELGKGSFATVVKAVNRAEGRWYAVKIIHHSKMKSRHVPAQGNRGNHDHKRELLREIRILENLKHPNICQLKEVFFDDSSISGAIYLVLELVDGGDLLEYIVNNDGLDENMTKHITYQLCDALAYIHGKGIAHRDLKPENVLLTSDDPPIVKVADFGLAKVIDSLTMLRTMCGTPSYLAPEVVMQVNSEGYDQLVDSWSVGVIIFSALANSSPFIEDTHEKDIARRIRTRVVEWNVLEQVGTSVEGRRFLQRLLEVDPSTRMTLAAAREHPWLHSRPYPDFDNHRSVIPIPSTESLDDGIDSDGRMQSEPQDEDVIIPVPNVSDAIVVSNGIRRLHLETGAGDPSSVGGGGSRTAPLQRRSKVVTAAAEDPDSALPEPTPEMIHRAESGAKKGQKRVRSELTPELSGGSGRERQARTGDVLEMGEDGGAAMPLRKPASTRGSRKNTAPASRSTRSGRVAVAVDKDESEEAAAGKPRRSARTGPQKAARR